jgi:hypothetical protein
MAQSSASIVADANKRIADFQKIETAITQEIAAIKDKEWTQPLSQQDLSQISILRAADSSVLAALEELSYVTMAALDKSDELNRIRNAIDGVIKDLNKQKSTIEKIAKVATAIGSAIGGLQSLQNKFGIVGAG